MSQTIFDLYIYCMLTIMQKAMNFVTLHYAIVRLSCRGIGYMSLINDYIKNIIQLIFAPSRGWEDLARSDERHENEEAVLVYNRCFLPFAVVCAFSSFIRMLYSGGPDFLQALQAMLITFISLFLASQISRYGFMMYLPRLIKPGTTLRWGRAVNMIIYCLTFLGLITFIANLIKVRIAILNFLPFYGVFIIWKGWKYLGIEEKNEGVFMILATALILGSAYLISFILSTLL